MSLTSFVRFARGVRMAHVCALVVLAPIAAAAVEPEKPAAKATESVKSEADAAAKPSQPKRPPAPVRVTKAAIADVPVVLDLVGQTQAVASIPVKTRIDSQIESLGVAEGDRVKAGQVIFTLDARAVRAQIAQARAVLARDRAQLALVQSDLERTEQLVTTKTKSARDLESAKTLVEAQQATIDADQATIDNLVVQASYYDIRSPIDGRVGSLPLKPGSSVRAADSTLLATINQLDPLYVTVAVPQPMVGRLRAAMTRGEVPIEVSRPSGAGAAKPVVGRVAFIENTLDAATGTLGVKATIPNADEHFLPGEFVQARLKLASDPNALTVPAAAVQIGQRGAFVWAIGANGTAETRPVTVDRTVDGASVVTKGLAAGDVVVVEGQLRLAPGATVEILADPAKPAKPGS
ncbi:MAG: efflux RND transporter periplasmic adaptor subunit [Hyphomicrobiales bacterium]|nr:efflux RND transporter periplasmic adaptor subunit [Hyphomicrobiales bacterium]